MAGMADNQPIMIPCEGSDQPGNVLGPRMLALVLSCTMCGSTFLDVTNHIPKHKRQDIAAMLARGDFDG